MAEYMSQQHDQIIPMHNLGAIHIAERGSDLGRATALDQRERGGIVLRQPARNLPSIAVKDAHRLPTLEGTLNRDNACR